MQANEPSSSPSGSEPVYRAAQYVRMSTEHQQYSTENQGDKIREYAARRNIEIVRTYADEGKSGLRINGRQALQQLIADVQSGKADFQIILVYDVSRWGRFQDADESAYYEYICKRQGISVAYVAEQFENDGSPVSTIVKGVKRAMAGEYSRELSAKVFAGQCRLIELGFRQGGPAGFGLRRVLIDHHLSPDGHFDLSFSYPDSSSTCFLVYSIIEALFGTDAITRQMAEALYVGIMTDTGNFAYSFLTPELFRAVAVLVEKGISIPEIHNNVYNAYTEGRARLFGYVINRKMEIIQDGTVAYMSLMENEMRRFQFQQGDSEGFVNYALTIKKMKMSAMFLAHRKFIRVSLRSRGDVDVNLFARKYFNGGGHKNAAGGKSFVSMQETIDHYIKSVKEFAQDGHLG